MKAKEQYTDHIISVIADNKPGVLSKVTGLITRRGFNVESITTGQTVEPGIFRVTIVVNGDDRSIEQIQKQLYKLVDIVKVFPIPLKDRVAREMALVQIKLVKGENSDLFNLLNIFKAEILDTSPGGIIVEVTGSPEKIDGFINLLPRKLLAGVARTGTVAMQKLTKISEDKPV